MTFIKRNLNFQDCLLYQKKKNKKLNDDFISEKSQISPLFLIAFSFSSHSFWFKIAFKPQF